MVVKVIETESHSYQQIVDLLAWQLFPLFIWVQCVQDKGCKVSVALHQGKQLLQYTSHPPFLVYKAGVIGNCTVKMYTLSQTIHSSTEDLMTT